MPFGGLLVLAFLLAILEWIAVLFDYRRVEYFAKPSVILVLLAWLMIAGNRAPQLWWFAAALVFSLAGDIFQLFSNKFFLAALSSFLLAHLAYVFGFNPSFPPVSIATLALFLLIGFTIAQIYRIISASLRSQGKMNLEKPVLIYMVAIGLMVFSALTTMIRPEKEWGIFPAILASIGALLFFTSDAIIAWDKFVHPFRFSRILVMVTYHLAQFAIIVAAVTNYA
jgi:uncharacterized membrane protein YhhN